MIRIEVADIENFEEIQKVLNHENISFSKIDSYNTMVIKDSDKIIGVASYRHLSLQAGEISLLYVVKEHRNKKLGDGLAKALLNLMDLRELKKATLANDCLLKDFFIKLGFQKDSDELYTLLPDFFKCACHSTQKEVTIDENFNQ